jgi:hypothetical protein
MGTHSWRGRYGAGTGPVAKIERVYLTRNTWHDHCGNSTPDADEARRCARRTRRLDERFRHAQLALHRAEIAVIAESAARADADRIHPTQKSDRRRGPPGRPGRHRAQTVRRDDLAAADLASGSTRVWCLPVRDGRAIASSRPAALDRDTDGSTSRMGRHHATSPRHCPPPASARRSPSTHQNLLALSSKRGVVIGAGLLPDPRTSLTGDQEVERVRHVVVLPRAYARRCS